MCQETEEALRGDVRYLTKERDALRAKLDFVTADRDRLAVEVGALQRNLDRADAKLAETQKERDAFGAQLVESRIVNGEKERAINEDLRATVERLEKADEVSSDMLGTQLDEINDLRARVKELERVLTPIIDRLRPILDEGPMDTYKGGHKQEDIIAVAVLGYSVLCDARNALKGGE